jgi:hypothetical protein
MTLDAAAMYGDYFRFARHLDTFTLGVADHVSGLQLNSSQVRKFLLLMRLRLSLRLYLVQPVEHDVDLAS